MRGKILVIGLFFTIALTGCNGVQTGDTERMETVETSDTGTEERETEVLQIKKIEYDYTAYKPHVKDIKDAENAELIYEDEKYKYYLEDTKSDAVIVTYEDGTKENIKEALVAKRVDIYDLGEAYIGCFVCEKNPVAEMVPKLINIVDSGWGTDLAVEKFYEDNDYKYYFSSMKSNFIHAYYTDGTREPIDDALAAGKVTIKDMDTYGVQYSKKANIVNVVDLTKNGDITCVQEREDIYKLDIWNCYFDCVKSMYIEIHYKNGTVETLKEAIEAGHVKLEELFDIAGEYSIGLHID